MLDRGHEVLAGPDVVDSELSRAIGAGRAHAVGRFGPSVWSGGEDNDDAFGRCAFGIEDTARHAREGAGDHDGERGELFPGAHDVRHVGHIPVAEQHPLENDPVGSVARTRVAPLSARRVKVPSGPHPAVSLAGRHAQRIRSNVALVA